MWGKSTLGVSGILHNGDDVYPVFLDEAHFLNISKYTIYNN